MKELQMEIDSLQAANHRLAAAVRDFPMTDEEKILLQKNYAAMRECYPVGVEARNLIQNAAKLLLLYHRYGQIPDMEIITVSKVTWESEANYHSSESIVHEGLQITTADGAEYYIHVAYGQVQLLRAGTKDEGVDLYTCSHNEILMLPQFDDAFVSAP